MYYQSDSIQLRDIHRQFGTRPLRHLPDHQHPAPQGLPAVHQGHQRRHAAQLRALRQGRRDAAAGRQVRLAALSAEALRVALHALLRGLLAATQVRLRHAHGAVFEPDRHRADDARRSAWSSSTSPALDDETARQEFEYVATKLGITGQRTAGLHGRAEQDPTGTIDRSRASTRSVRKAMQASRPGAGRQAMISIVDYGLGNIQAIRQHLQAAGHSLHTVTSRPPSLRDADAHHPARRRRLRLGHDAPRTSRACARTLDEAVHRQRTSRCWASASACRCWRGAATKALLPGLGWIDAEVQRFDDPASRRCSLSCRTWAGTMSCRASTDGLFTDFDRGRAVLFPALLLLRAARPGRRAGRPRLRRRIRLRACAAATSTACSSTPRRATAGASSC